MPKSRHSLAECDRRGDGHRTFGNELAFTFKVTFNGPRGIGSG